jgi:hypothetical protein
MLTIGSGEVGPSMAEAAAASDMNSPAWDAGSRALWTEDLAHARLATRFV